MRARFLCLAGVVACGEEVASPPTESAETSLAAASASAAPTVQSVTKSANAPPLQSASAIPTLSSWLGPIPNGDPAKLGKISRYDREGRFSAALAIPIGWADRRLEDGMSGNSFGILTRPSDKTAVVIVIEHGAIHESLVEFGAERWLGISGGAGDLSWGEIEPAPHAGEGFSLRRGRGKLWGAPAELIQLRRRVPSAEKGPETLLLLGAVKTSAPRERREEYLACLASYTASGP